MKQLSLFNLENSQPEKAISNRWKLFVDGASRNNPGLSGAGVYLLKNDLPVVKQGFFLGVKTNNQAEYFALLLGVFFAQRHMLPHDTLLIHSDSELLIKQFKGEYEIRNTDLKELYLCIMQRLKGISYSMRHIMRKDNSVADLMANMGIDKKLPLPQELMHLCPLNNH